MPAALLTWTALFALYLLFAGQADRAELCAGALMALAGTFLAVFLHQHEHRPMRDVAPWLALARRVGVALLRDPGVMTRALAHAVAGSAREGATQLQAFEGNGSSAEVAFRRGVVVLAASLAPNGFVQEVALDDHILLVHRLVPSPPSDDVLWPV